MKKNKNEKWKCQNCGKQFEPTDKFGRVETYYGFLCHKCITQKQNEGEQLSFEDEQEEIKMLKNQKFKVYEYPLKGKNNKTYYGSYTIKENVKPLGFFGEKLVDTFETPVKFNFD